MRVGVEYLDQAGKDVTATVDVPVSFEMQVVKAGSGQTMSVTQVKPLDSKVIAQQLEAQMVVMIDTPTAMAVQASLARQGVKAPGPQNKTEGAFFYGQQAAMTKVKEPYCDGSDGSGAPCVGEFRWLDIGGGSHLALCKRHYEKEMAWRKERNTNLSPDSQFDIPTWESLEVVDEGGAIADSDGEVLTAMSKAGERWCDGSDGATPCIGEQRTLPFANGNLHLCRKHFEKEMAWRKAQNRNNPPDSQYDIPKWESLKVYTDDINDLREPPTAAALPHNGEIKSAMSKGGDEALQRHQALVQAVRKHRHELFGQRGTQDTIRQVDAWLIAYHQPGPNFDAAGEAEAIAALPPSFQNEAQKSTHSPMEKVWGSRLQWEAHGEYEFEALVAYKGQGLKCLVQAEEYKPSPTGYTWSAIIFAVPEGGPIRSNPHATSSGEAKRWCYDQVNLIFGQLDDDEAPDEKNEGKVKAVAETIALNADNSRYFSQPGSGKVARTSLRKFATVKDAIEEAKTRSRNSRETIYVVYAGPNDYRVHRGADLPGEQADQAVATVTPELDPQDVADGANQPRVTDLRVERRDTSKATTGIFRAGKSAIAVSQFPAPRGYNGRRMTMNKSTDFTADAQAHGWKQVNAGDATEFYIGIGGDSNASYQVKADGKRGLLYLSFSPDSNERRPDQKLGTFYSFDEVSDAISDFEERNADYFASFQNDESNPNDDVEDAARAPMQKMNDADIISFAQQFLERDHPQRTSTPQTSFVNLATALTAVGVDARPRPAASDPNWNPDLIAMLVDGRAIYNTPRGWFIASARAPMHKADEESEQVLCEKLAAALKAEGLDAEAFNSGGGVYVTEVKRPTYSLILGLAGDAYWGWAKYKNDEFTGNDGSTGIQTADIPGTVEFVKDLVGRKDREEKKKGNATA
jgi:hypothetical protein